MILVLYVVLTLVSWPMLSLLLLRDVAQDYREVISDDIVLATMLGLGLALIWPLMIPAAFVYHILSSSEVSK